MKNVHLIAQTQSFQIPRSLFERWKEMSRTSSSECFQSTEDPSQFFVDIDPSMVTVYLLFLQSGYLIRPVHLSNDDFLDGLHRCGAPSSLIDTYHYETSFPSPIDRTTCLHQSLHFVIIIGFILLLCLFSIDLYQQMFFVPNASLMMIIYITEGVFFLFNSWITIVQLFSIVRQQRPWRKNLKWIMDLLSLFSILSYLTIQRPLPRIVHSRWNTLWIAIHLLRTIRFAQFAFCFEDLQRCLNAILHCFSLFFQTLISLSWFFLFSGSILFLVDLLEKNEQYLNIQSTILSAHETLYAIGYRNNAPSGRFTRLWTMITIYFLSSCIQTLLWWFQTRVTFHWKQLHRSSSKSVRSMIGIKIE